MKKNLFLTPLLFFIFLLNHSLYAQGPVSIDTTGTEAKIQMMEERLSYLEDNLSKMDKQFKTGAVMAAAGYTVTIIGGLMLGRENDDLGQGLLIAGGTIGLGGTIVLVDAFKYLGRSKKRRDRK
ncbi:hypothetical protein OO013_19705 [Mangrovivirga sp. M17]|uniref:Uncharacterized protein n=1 Tax=Mangrovivirga halotolerans TaxID=2993936 RepID=A0ABT3RWH4_9BACT|nr:hypothetical protein [Mangrovivirga halotolerans]MCX2746114.1 hypothetical protein [Mangrovivirga halotolerans]